MARKKSRQKQKPAWERAYKGHVLWLGKVKLGRVTLSEKGRYTWQAGGRAGTSEDLDRAKRAVEMAAAMADKQLDLFP